MLKQSVGRRSRFRVPGGMVLMCGLLLTAAVRGWTQEPPGRELEQLILRQDWERACALLAASPPQPARAPVLVASAWIQCLVERHQPQTAWRFARSWLQFHPSDGEDVWVRYIDLTDQLYHQNRSPRYWETYRSFLRHPQRFVRYYAAFRLTYWQEDHARREALTVLREILDRETDPNLLARAQLAWMRVDPKSVPKVASDRFHDLKAYILVQVTEQRNQAQIQLRLPLVWAVWWLQNNRDLPIDEATRERLIRSIQNARKLRRSQTLLEIMEPEAHVRIELVYGGQEKNTPGETPP